MRFIDCGPVIPDKLLLARDQGRVVFFCGAGVSRAFAKLDDFFSLASKVTTALGVHPDSPALKILREARNFEEKIGVSGLISADRIFGLLEKDFDVRAIEAAVATALTPGAEPDLTAHKILVDLATTETGATQLVTTNFDRLFDACRPNLLSWQPPRLPDLSRPGELDGIVYLHGKANETYTKAEGDGFVLSSGSFGRAYLADGWATQFVKSVLERYVVVFIGYSADDPPVHYLLEALNRSSNTRDGIYAFQPGSAENASDRWVQRGVEAIAYDPVDQHQRLWKSLEAWAGRARNPTKWFRDVIRRSQVAPSELMPFERGQFAHVISTQHGAKMVAELDQPPPADWFCVLDPYRRFAKPGYTSTYPDRGPYVDPFDLYGIDADLPPAAVSPDDRNVKREVPADSWDGFAMSFSDRENLATDQMTALRGAYSSNVARLPSRLWFLGVWLANVAGDPASVWWAANQNGLHPTICDLVTRRLNRPNIESTVEVRNAWQYLFEAWQAPENQVRRDVFALAERVKREGWSSPILRQYALLTRPFVKAGPNWRRPIPPNAGDELRLATLVDLDVIYPLHSDEIPVPNEWLVRVLAEGRRNLEIAIGLEAEVNFGFHLGRLAPVNPSDDPEVDGYDRSHGLSAAVIRHANRTKGLSAFDGVGARREVTNWLGLEGTPFERLRIWAAGDPALTSLATSEDIFHNIDGDVFWDPHHQRDFLLSLAARWSELGMTAREIIEGRVLKGPATWEGEDQDRFAERHAWSILNRLHFLQAQGCALSFDVASEIQHLREIVPDWNQNVAAEVTRSTESRGGWVRTDPEFGELLSIPLSDVLRTAAALDDRKGPVLVQRKPFVGLSGQRPVRALMALKRFSGSQEYLRWGWRIFLGSETRQSDRRRLVRVIGNEILALAPATQIELAGEVADWLGHVAAHLTRVDCALWDRLVKLCLKVFASDPQYQRSNIIRSDKEVDWVMDSINSAAGRLAKAMLDDTRLAKKPAGGGLPQPWLEHVEGLLKLPGQGRRFALVTFGRSLNWFYWIAPSWTETNLLTSLSAADPVDRDAFWSGFLFSNRIPTEALYRRLKVEFLGLPQHTVSEQRDQGAQAAAILLAGWASIDKQTGSSFIAADELRSVLVTASDGFRSHVLWTIGRWIAGEKPKAPLKWSSLQIELLKTIWPKQRTARSARVSSRLLDLAFANPKLFPAMVEAILPLLGPIDQEHISMPALYRDKDSFTSKHPDEVLAVLTTILPENPGAWPYGIEGTFDKIQKANPKLANDPRLLELLRRWDGR